MSRQEVSARLEQIRKSPCIKDKLDVVLENNSNRFLGTIHTRKKQLIEGKLMLKDIDDIEVILRLATPNEKQKIYDMLVDRVKVHDMSILEYRTLFNLNASNGNLPLAIIDKLKLIGFSTHRKDRKEFFEEIRRVKGYVAPYIPSEGERIGYLENPGDKEPKMFTITDEHRQIAKTYLNVIGDFYCNKTMQATLMRIAKGELDAEKVTRIQRERELRALQEEDKKLDEIAVLARSVIEQTQDLDVRREKKQKSPGIESKKEDVDDK